jgi:rhodanese-related sulfurtransferase
MSGRGLFGASPAGSLLPTVSYNEAVDLFNARAALFIDARHGYDYAEGRIRGAINLPLQDFSPDHLLLSIIPRQQPLVTYCDGEGCNSSIELARKLDSLGYKDVRIFFGGWNEWKAHNGPVEP